MDLPITPPQTCSSKEMTSLLFQAGKSLRGRNLRKSSWQEIAESVSNKTGALKQSVWDRLRSATTRDNAIKALRLVRKQSRRKSARTSASAKAKRRDTVSDKSRERTLIDREVCPLRRSEHRRLRRGND